MRKFLAEVLQFTGVLLCFVLIGLLLPMTPRAATSLLNAKIDKDELLQNTDSPRIILVGGSNLSFGINSQIIKDSLGLQPVNTAIHASLGLRYMLSSIAGYVRPTDVIVIVPEYSHFFQRDGELSTELLRTLIDIKPSDRQFLKSQQYRRFIEELPKYALSKFKLGEYLFTDNPTVYSRSAFNDYGDVALHRNLPRRTVIPQPRVDSVNFNVSVFDDLENEVAKLTGKGAQVLFAFPSFQDKSFDNLSAEIELVQSELEKRKLRIVGHPKDFRMADSLMFDSPYHLNGRGVEIRTKRLVELIKPHLEAGASN